ncbi:MAG: DUF5329 family protein [Methylomicrobium sp.]
MCSISQLSIFLLSGIYAIGGYGAGNAEREIAHLIKFVENTPCYYERNGELHSGREAAEHIRKKYDHFKDEISTAEDFIALSATKSELTGKKYRVLCEGENPLDSNQWLLGELKTYRQ